MDRFRRPKAPPGFNRAARAARAKIRNLVHGGHRPESKQFDDAWSDFKHVLIEAQHGRCGYCDRPVHGGDDGTIDHYCPKALIEALYDDPSTWGTQKAHSASIRDRETQHVSDLGYHWLAYAWNNYVFACSCCNEKWKKALFPVARHPRRYPPHPRGCEGPLLLSCYSALRPSAHLQFNDDGTVEAMSRHGEETIRTVGLYRDPLRDEREGPARDAHDALLRFAEGDEEAAVRDLRKLGSARRAFAGVVRAIVEQRLEMTWEDFVTTFSARPLTS